jgi:hypothetical protein
MDNDCICPLSVEHRTIFQKDCVQHGWDESPDEVDRRNFARRTRMRAEAFSRIDAPASAKVWTTARKK